MPADLRVFGTIGELFQAAANEFASRLERAARERGRFCVALSGGNTPKGLYGLLAGGAYSSLPWDKVFFFWSDERHVPPDHPDSNYRTAKEALLSRISVPAENVFRFPAEDSDAEKAALKYDQTLKTFFGARGGDIPRFDLILLGMGADGHTASLFPGSRALEENSRLVVANWVEKLKSYRFTFTFPLINQARCVMFLVTGKDKASALSAVLGDSPSALPSQRVRPVDGELLWLLDQAAAGALRKSA